MTRNEFANAYRRGFTSTVRFLLSTGVPADRADEIAQAGWTRGWERREQLNEPSKIVSWINTISLNLFRKRLRRQHETEELPEIASRPRDGASAIDVRKGLEQCTPQDRELLRSYYVEGFTSKELGGRKKCSAEAIRVRVLRAKRRLANLIGGEYRPNQPVTT
jgi:RNA polymerase sigma factor (sigma-70 family)